MSCSPNMTWTGQCAYWAVSSSELMKFPSAGFIMAPHDDTNGSVGTSSTPSDLISPLSASLVYFWVKDTVRQSLIWRLWLENAIRGWPKLRGWLSQGTLLHIQMSKSGYTQKRLIPNYRTQAWFHRLYDSTGSITMRCFFSIYVSVF